MSFDNDYLEQLFAAQEIASSRLNEKISYTNIVLLKAQGAFFEEGVIYVGESAMFPEDLSRISSCCLIMGGAARRTFSNVSCNYILLSSRCTVQTAFERIFNAWSSYEYRMTLGFSDALAGCETIAEIISCTSAAMGCPVLLGDPFNRLLLCEGSMDIEEPLYTVWTETGMVPEEICDAAVREGVSQRMEGSSIPVYVGRGQFWNCNRILHLIDVDGHREGILAALETGQPFTFRDYNRIIAAGNAISENLRHARKCSGVSRRPETGSVVYEQCLLSLLRGGGAGEPGKNSWLRFWKLYMGWGERQFFRVCYIEESCPKLRPREESVLRSACPQDQAVVTPFEEGLFCLIGTNERREEEAAFASLTSALAEFSCHIFYEDVFRKIEELPEQIQLMQNTQMVCRQLGLQRQLCSWNDVQIYGLLLKIPREIRQKAYRDNKLDRLREYDRRRGTGYYTSLYEYLQCACDKTRMAQKLFIHRNTAACQISRIEEILGIDLRDGETCLRLYLSYKLAELEETSGDQ